MGVSSPTSIILMCFVLQISAFSVDWDTNEIYSDFHTPEKDYSYENEKMTSSEENFLTIRLQEIGLITSTQPPSKIKTPGPGSKPDNVDGVFISSPPFPGTGKVFLFPSDQNERKGDFFHTQGYCRKHGAEMVSIHSLEENTFLHNWVKRLGKIHPGIWLGSTIVNESTTIMWENGLPTDFVYWSKTDPNEGEFSCLLTGWEESNLWWDYSCVDKRFNVVCQKRSPVAAPAPPSITEDASLTKMPSEDTAGTLMIETNEIHFP